MTGENDSLEPTDEDVGRLHELLLAAVVSGEPLPGRERPTALPDRDFVVREEVVLADENLRAGFSPESIGRPVRILSPEMIEAEARGGGDLPYLRFQPAVVEEDAIWVTLEGRIALQGPEERALGLSGLRVPFTRGRGGWVAVGDPIAFAA